VKARISTGRDPINVVETQLDWYSTSYRTTQLWIFMAWAQNFGAPALVGGDFNSWWGEYWITHMETAYTDTWFDVTHNQDGGYSTGNVRFDFLFRLNDQNWRITPVNIWVVATSLSDHWPVVAYYKI